MKVRAKFVVTAVHHDRYGTAVTLEAVVNGSDENKSFFAATPSGSIEMRVVSKEVAAAFSPAKEFYVDFSAAGDES